MDKSYFKKRKEEIQSEIDSWGQELRDLRSDYISSNQKFPIGSKVCITTPAHTKFFAGKKISVPEQKRFAYVSRYEIRCDEVVPVLLKAKKDGSASKLNDYVMYNSEIIELA